MRGARKFVWVVLILTFLLDLGESSGGPVQPESILKAQDALQGGSQLLVSASRSPDVLLRARAAVACGRVLQPESIDVLLNLVIDESALVRREAIFAAGQYGWKAEFSDGHEEQILTILEKLFDESRPELRALVVEAAGKLALARAPELLQPFLADPAPEVRAEAALGLYRARLIQSLREAEAELPPLPEPVMSALLGLAKDADPAVRRNVMYYFARVKDERGLDVVLELAGDGDPWVRFFAITALRRLGMEEGLAAALEAAGDEQDAVRLAAVQAVGALGRAEELPSTLLGDPSFHVRAAYASAAAENKSFDTTVLVKLWLDRHEAVRAAVLPVLAARRQGNVLELLEPAAGSESWILREAAVQAAAVLEKPKATAFVTGLLGDPDELVRTAALQALVDLEAEQTEAALRAALRSSGLAERGTAALLLQQRKDDERFVLAWEAYRGSRDREWIEVRETLVDVLIEEGGARSEEWLREVLLDPAPSVAVKAREALEKRGAEDLPEKPRQPEMTRTPHWERRFEKNPRVVLETTQGRMQIECYAKDAPIHVANFVGLVESGFYDGLLWHRVVPNFVIQGGDPTGTGWGDAGYSLRAENNQHRYVRGTVGMPRSSGFHTGSCQIFINHVPTPHLDGQYTIFGQVVEGLDVIDRIARGDRILKAWVVQ